MSQSDELRREWLTALMEAWEGKLLSYLYKMGVKEQLAREFVQEAFVRVWSHHEVKTKDPQASAWLYRVCRNLAIDHLRKEGREIFMDDDKMEGHPDDNENPESSLQGKENQSFMSEILSVLTAAEKEVIKLKFQDELSYREISEVTGHSVSYVGVLLHEAMSKLRSHVVSAQNSGRAL